MDEYTGGLVAELAVLLNGFSNGDGRRRVGDDAGEKAVVRRYAELMLTTPKQVVRAEAELERLGVRMDDLRAFVASRLGLRGVRPLAPI